MIDEGNKLWTVSAGAFRMLESLYSDHIAGNDRRLLPCCGHFMCIDDKTGKLIMIGCPNGVDWSVIHKNHTVRLITDSGTAVIMPYDDYRNTVFEFADEIKAFYDRCAPKQPASDYDNDMYQRFWSDWKTLRNGNPL